jgi:hypothetical protein
MTLAELVAKYLKIHQAAPSTIEKLRWLLSKGFCLRLWQSKSPMCPNDLTSNSTRRSELAEGVELLITDSSASTRSAAEASRDPHAGHASSAPQALPEDPSARHHVSADADPMRLVPWCPRAQP